MRNLQRTLAVLALWAIAEIGSAQSAGALVYTALGDSITNGYPVGVTGRWPQLVANQLSSPLVDTALIGDSACDLFPHQIYSHNVVSHAGAGALYSVMVGTNDVDTKGTGAYETVFSACHLADLAWLVIPRENMIEAGDAGMAGGGGWSAAPDGSNVGFSFAGAYAAGPGTLTLSPVVAPDTTGAYLFYTISDTAAVGASFTVSDENGQALGVYSAKPAVSIATQNGTSTSIAAVRLPLTAGAHQLTLTTATGGVSVLALGTLPTLPSGPPTILSGDIPSQAQATPVAAAASITQYNADVRRDELALIGDGATILHVPDQQYMLGTAAEMAPGDSLHLSAVGNQHMAAAYLAVVAQVPAVSTGAAVSTTNTTTQFCGTDCTVNDYVDTVFTYGAVTVTLPVVAHGAGGRRITVTSFNASTATTVVQPAGWNLYDSTGQVQQVVVPGGHTRCFQSYTANPTDTNWFVFVQ